MSKRTNYISWEEYFMALVKLSEHRSKDPSTQVGAVITDMYNKIISIGYNGMPNGLSDDEMSWERDSKNELDNKYFYVCHAELNAIANSNINLKGTIIYVSLFPCNECAKLIIQHGIKKVVYYDDKYANLDSTIASKRMFDKAGIEYIAYEKKGKVISLEL